MIEDNELRALFRAEGEEHLQTLDEGLLRLETHPDDKTALEAVFRSAHSLKGAARMLGLDDVELLAHAFEDLLGASRAGAALKDDVIESLLGALDSLRALIREAITGTPAGIDVIEKVSGLKSVPSSSSSPAPSDTATFADTLFPNPPISPSSSPHSPPSNPTPRGWASEPEENDVSREQPQPASTHLSEEYEENDNLSAPPVSSSPVLSAPTPPTHSQESETPPASATAPTPHASVPPEHIPPSQWPVVTRPRAPVGTPKFPVNRSAVPTPPVPPASVVPSASESWKIETMRVEPARLDTLLAMAGELIVATTRAARGRQELEDLQSVFEEEQRLAKARRRIWNTMESELETLLAQSEHMTGLGALNNTLRDLRRQGERENERLELISNLLSRLHETIGEMTRIGSVVSAMEEAIRGVRMLPLSTLFSLFPRMVRDLARSIDKEVHLVIEGGETAADKRVLEELKDPLMHLIRNALDHGVETPTQRLAAGKPREALLILRGYQTATQVVVELVDDGHGLDLEAIRRVALKKGLLREEELAALTPPQVQNLIFAPGFSTAPMVTDVSGRGVGLDVVRANVERLRGSIHVESVQGQGCTFRLTLPLTLATTRVLLVRLGASIFAIPVEAVESVQLILPSHIFPVRGRPAVTHGGRPVSLVHLASVLGQGAESNAAEGADSALPCVFLGSDEQTVAFLVDGVLDEQEIIVKPFGPLLGRVRNLMGSTIQETGEVALVLNPPDLLQNASMAGSLPAIAALAPPERPKHLLLVEDSITTRTQEKRILETAGYSVVTAVDGEDGWEKLLAGTSDGGNFDAVVTDIEMPRLTGLGLAGRIRQNVAYRDMPIILVTSLASDADRARGVEVGADAYITKGGFDQKALLDALQRLV